MNKRFRKVVKFRQLYDSEWEVLFWLLLGNSIVINAAWILLLITMTTPIRNPFVMGVSLILLGVFNIIMLFRVNDRTEYYEEIR